MNETDTPEPVTLIPTVPVRAITVHELRHLVGRIAEGDYIAMSAERAGQLAVELRDVLDSIASAEDLCREFDDREPAFVGSNGAQLWALGDGAEF